MTCLIVLKPLVLLFTSSCKNYLLVKCSVKYFSRGFSNTEHFDKGHFDKHQGPRNLASCGLQIFQKLQHRQKKNLS